MLSLIPFFEKSTVMFQWISNEIWDRVDGDVTGSETRWQWTWRCHLLFNPVGFGLNPLLERDNDQAVVSVVLITHNTSGTLGYEVLLSPLVDFFSSSNIVTDVAPTTKPTIFGRLIFLAKVARKSQRTEAITLATQPPVKLGSYASYNPHTIVLSVLRFSNFSYPPPPSICLQRFTALKF